jgi:epsilon-lactone hydrolase
LPSMRSRALWLVMSAMGGTLGYRNLDAVRRKVEKQLRHPAGYGPPKRLRRSCDVTLDFPSGWPCYTVTPRTAVAPSAQVLYLHGGGYIEEVGANHWALIKELAVRGRSRVVVPVYPLAPRGTAGSFLPGLTALARTLTSGSHLPAVFMGDSAGGGLALAATQRLRDEGEAVPDRLLLISPWLDALLGNPEIKQIQPYDPMLAVEPLRWTGALWAGELAPSHPAVSPLNGGVTGLPPIEVYVGTRDILLPDARRLGELARLAGTEVELREAVGQIHVYPLWPTPEGRRARQEIMAGIERAAG